MTPQEHRDSAKRIREAYKKQKDSFAFNHLLPTLAAIHEDMADAAEGKVTPPPTIGEIDTWANTLCRRVMGINPRPQPITNWDVWTEKMLTPDWPR